MGSESITVREFLPPAVPKNELYYSRDDMEVFRIDARCEYLAKKLSYQKFLLENAMDKDNYRLRSTDTESTDKTELLRKIYQLSARSRCATRNRIPISSNGIIDNVWRQKRPVTPDFEST